MTSEQQKLFADISAQVEMQGIAVVRFTVLKGGPPKDWREEKKYCSVSMMTLYAGESPRPYVHGANFVYDLEST